MTQNVCVSVQMDEKSFHDFASFDLLHHNKGWQRPAVFTAILLVCAVVCLSQIGKREGAGLLTAVLAIVALGLPAVYFGTFFSNLSKQIKKLGLPRPFYRLELDAAGLSLSFVSTALKRLPLYELGFGWVSVAALALAVSFALCALKRDKKAA